MKRIIILLLLAGFVAVPPAMAQQATGGPQGQTEVFEGIIGPTYNWVDASGGPAASEYDYKKSSGGFDLLSDYDALPNRFSAEAHMLNEKDYFGSFDYAYHDIVLISVLGRGIHHNLDHLTLGKDDPTTLQPSFTDLNPDDVYSVDSQIFRGFVRLKLPDYPMHLFADTLVVDRSGLIQQRYLRGFTGGYDKVSQSRDIDWKSQELRIGLNSHFGPIEVEVSHTGKSFDPHGQTVLYDSYTSPVSMSVPHNLTPELKSSVDTFRAHTSSTGRIVAGMTLANGTNKNEYSNAKMDYKNMAGDITFTPVAGLTFLAKYRHYDLNETTPATVTSVTGASPATVNPVRDALLSKRDTATGIVRFRVTDRLTVRAEYEVESIKHTNADGSVLTYSTGTALNLWAVADHTTKTSETLGLSYRAMNTLNLRADYKATQVENPAYADDPDMINVFKTTATWTPVSRVIALVSYGDTQERRNDLSAPLGGGERKVTRDQVLGSVTLLAGRRSSITASYSLYQVKNKQTLTYWMDSGYVLEDGVSLSTKSETVSLAATHSLTDAVQLNAEASRTKSTDGFVNSGAVAGTQNDVLTDQNVTEDILSAGIAVRFTRFIGGEVRYRHVQFDDKTDPAGSGRSNTMLATVNAKW
jgi:hypothetical protein